MDNPEYTEARINKALDAARLRRIRAHWDGEIVSSEDPAVFLIYNHSDETDLTVVDGGGALIVRTCDDGVFRDVGYATRFEELAELLREAVGEQA